MTPIIFSFDERRDLIIAKDLQSSVEYAALHFLNAAKSAIAEKGFFAAALSGGSTPKAIFKQITVSEEKNSIDWTKVSLYWSDERCVPPDDAESNFKMAMESGLKDLNIPSEQIFRMKGEEDPEAAGKSYDAELQKLFKVNQGFDYLMLGVGEDGHTASLFPHTHALHTVNRLAVANYVPQKKCWRLTLTFEAINESRFIAIYAFGLGKAEIIEQVLEGEERSDELPVQRVGTASHRANFFLDDAAASLLTLDLG